MFRKNYEKIERVEINTFGYSLLLILNKLFKEEENLLGYIIKYNPTEKLYFSPKQESNIIKLYTFKEYKYNNYSTKNLNYVFIRNKRIFKSIG